MDKEQTILALAALSQPTRLDAFQLLVRHMPAGLPAGEIAQRLAVPHNTMSTHLAVLSRAGMVAAQRQGRSIRYRAELEAFRAVVTYLLTDCCGGHPEICASLVDDLAQCCSRQEPAHA